MAIFDKPIYHGGAYLHFGVPWKPSPAPPLYLRWVPLAPVSHRVQVGVKGAGQVPQGWRRWACRRPFVLWVLMSASRPPLP